MGMIFCFYIGFFIFVLTNTITAIFVDSVSNYSAEDESSVIQEQLQRKEEYMAKIAALYERMDRDGSGDVSYDEFIRHLTDPRMTAFAECLEIHASDFEQFFKILSANGKRPVDLATFVEGC